MNAFCIVDDVYGRRELHASELRGFGLSAATTLRPVRCSGAAISASARVAEMLTILVIRQHHLFDERGRYHDNAIGISSQNISGFLPKLAPKMEGHVQLRRLCKGVRS